MAISASAARTHTERTAEKLLLEQAVALTARLAHDFGNCLTGILGFAELSAKQVPEGSLAQRYLNEVCQSARDAAGWVQRLHSLSRGRVPSFTPADLAESVEEETSRLRPRLKGAALCASVADGLPPLAIDKDSLGRILIELLDNACEAVAARGVIQIEARAVRLTADDCRTLWGGCEPGRRVEITITDSGPGLPPEFEQQLAARFLYSTKRRQRGIGLATVRTILHAYRGGMRFGPHPDRGTAVHVFLPPAASASPGADEVSPTIVKQA